MSAEDAATPGREPSLRVVSDGSARCADAARVSPAYEPIAALAALRSSLLAAVREPTTVIRVAD